MSSPTTVNPGDLCQFCFHAIKPGAVPEQCPTCGAWNVFWVSMPSPEKAVSHLVDQLHALPDDYSDADLSPQRLERFHTRPTSMTGYLKHLRRIWQQVDTERQSPVWGEAAVRQRLVLHATISRGGYLVTAWDPEDLMSTVEIARMLSMKAAGQVSRQITLYEFYPNAVQMGSRGERGFWFVPRGDVYTMRVRNLNRGRQRPRKARKAGKAIKTK